MRCGAVRCGAVRCERCGATSKQMFSPSRSQSSHSTRWSAPLASCSRCAHTAPLVGTLVVSAPKRSCGSTSHASLGTPCRVCLSRLLRQERRSEAAQEG